MGCEAARPQDRRKPAVLQGQPGRRPRRLVRAVRSTAGDRVPLRVHARRRRTRRSTPGECQPMITLPTLLVVLAADSTDRKSTRLNSSHGYISYAVFCLKKKKTTQPTNPEQADQRM